MTRARARARSGSADRYGMLERAAQAAARRNGAALWYLGRDLASVFGDANGTTAPALSGLAGLLLDRSFGLAETIGPNVVTNPSFSAWTSDNPTGWTLAFTETATTYVTQHASGARLVSDGAYNGITQLALTVGRRYRATITIAAVTSGEWAFCSPAISTIRSGTTAGTFTVEFVATSQEIALKRSTSGVAGNFVIGSLSVQDVTDGVLGAELVTNGAFTDATGWTADSSFSISGGVANFTGASGFMSQTATSIVPGRTYLLSYDVNITAGAVQFSVGGTTAPTGHGAGATGRRSYYITATSNASPRVYSNAASGWVDNVSVREVLGFAAAQSTAGNRPTIVLLPSGYYGLRFDGTDDYLGASPPAATPSAEVFIGAATSTVAAEVRAIVGRRSATASGGLIRTNGNRYEAVAISAGTAAGVMDTATAVASDAPYVVTGDFTATRAGVRVNGGTRYIADRDLTLSPNTVKLGIGSFAGDSFAQGWKGDVALVAWATAALPDADRIAIERFAALLAGAPYTG